MAAIDRLNKIVKQAEGTYSETIIKLAKMICAELEILHNRGDCECADLPVSKVQTAVRDSVDDETLPDPLVPIEENTGSNTPDEMPAVKFKKEI